MLSMFKSHFVNDQALVLFLGMLLSTIGNVATSMFWIYLSYSIAVFVGCPPNVDGVIVLVVSSLKGSSGNLSTRAIDPGQVAVTGSHQNLILLLDMFLSSPGDVAALVVRIDLAWEETSLMVGTSHVEKSSITADTCSHGALRDVIPFSLDPLATSLISWN